jgi:pyruvate decarboxylase
MYEDNTLILSSSSSFLSGQDLVLPTGCQYNFQMQYGSIGWAVGATLGAAMAVGRTRQVVSLIGDLLLGYVLSTY